MHALYATLWPHGSGGMVVHLRFAIRNHPERPSQCYYKLSAVIGGGVTGGGGSLSGARAQSVRDSDANAESANKFNYK